jgi:hypothetical protein
MRKYLAVYGEPTAFRFEMNGAEAEQTREDRERLKAAMLGSLAKYKDGMLLSDVPTFNEHFLEREYFRDGSILKLWSPSAHTRDRVTQRTLGYS